MVEFNQKPVESDINTWNYMPWEDAFVMQNGRLTREHYRLVYLTNLIQYELTCNRESEAKRIFIKDLVPLAKRHLRYELLVMVVIDYKGINPDGFKRHCEAHANLQKGIDDICDNIDQTDMSEISAFLKKWLNDHIKVEDRAYNEEIVKLKINDENAA